MWACKRIDEDVYLIVTSDLISPTREGNDPPMAFESKSKVWRLDKLINDVGNVPVRKFLDKRKSRKLIKLPRP